MELDITLGIFLLHLPDSLKLSDINRTINHNINKILWYMLINL